MGSRYPRILIYDVKITTEIDGMGPFKYMAVFIENLNLIFIPQGGNLIRLFTLGVSVNLEIC